MSRISTTRIALTLFLALALVPATANAGAKPAKKAEKAEKAEKKTEKKAEKPVVVLETNKGTIEIELWPKKAPETVENFLQYVNDGFYDGTIFHRVIPGFMIQGGGFTKDYKKKETRAPIKNEADNGAKNLKYTVAMARTSDPHSATAQFFINVANNAFLDHRNKTTRGWGYTVFGKVLKGQEVVDAIAKTKTGPGGPFPKDAPQEQVVIEKAHIKK